MPACYGIVYCVRAVVDGNIGHVLVACRKLRGEVVDKEREAFEERQQQSQYKPIERRKLEGNIKDFVRMSIRRMHATRAGLAT